jgi:ribonuclease HI
MNTSSMGKVKMNVDGAIAKTENKGAFSVICRNDKGVFLGDSSITIDGLMDPEVLEAMACAEALSLAAGRPAT